MMFTLTCINDMTYMILNMWEFDDSNDMYYDKQRVGLLDFVLSCDVMLDIFFASVSCWIQGDLQRGYSFGYDFKTWGIWMVLGKD